MKLNIRLNEDGVPVLQGLQQARDAVASVESAGSGDYKAIGPRTRSGDRAYGRYQVMGRNIPIWTQQTLGRSMTPQEFLANPEAQDAVFDQVFGGFVKQFGNIEDAASVWFSGKPLAEAGGRRDILGTTPEQYVNNFRAALGSAPALGSASALGSAPQETSPGRFGVPTPPSPVIPVGDVVRGQFGLNRVPADRRGIVGEGGGGGIGNFGSRFRTQEGVRQFEAESGLRPGSIEPVARPAAEVVPMQRPTQVERAGGRPDPAKIAEGLRRSSSTAWLYGKEATKLGLPNRIAKAVRDNPDLKPSLRVWVNSLDTSAGKPEIQLEGMRQLSRLLTDFGF